MARIIVLHDDVNKTAISKVNTTLLEMIAADDEIDARERNFKRKPIYLHVETGGGDIYDMWSLIDIIETSKTPIYTVCTGHAFSAGFQIFLAGHKRYIGRHAVLMYHQMSQNDYGKYQDLLELRPTMERHVQQIEDYVQKKTGWSKDFIQQIREQKKDYFMFAEEVVDMNIAEYYNKENI